MYLIWVSPATGDAVWPCKNVYALRGITISGIVGDDKSVFSARTIETAFVVDNYSVIDNWRLFEWLMAQWHIHSMSHLSTAHRNGIPPLSGIAILRLSSNPTAIFIHSWTYLRYYDSSETASTVVLNSSGNLEWSFAHFVHKLVFQIQPRESLFFHYVEEKEAGALSILLFFSQSVLPKGGGVLVNLLASNHPQRRVICFRNNKVVFGFDVQKIRSLVFPNKSNHWIVRQSDYLDAYCIEIKF